MAARRHWSAATKAGAVARVRAGEPAAAVARDLGTSAPIVWSWCYAAGFRRGRRGGVRHPRWREAVARVRGGETRAAVARAVGVSAACVSRWCRSAGLPMQPRHRPGREMVEFVPQTIAELIEILRTLERRGFRIVMGEPTGDKQFSIRKSIFTWKE